MHYHWQFYLLSYPLNMFNLWVSLRNLILIFLEIPRCPPPPQIPRSQNMTTTVNYQEGETISILCQNNSLSLEAEDLVCQGGIWKSVPRCTGQYCVTCVTPVKRGLDSPVLCGKGQMKPFLHICSTSPRIPTSQSRYRSPSALFPLCCDVSTDRSPGLQQKQQPPLLWTRDSLLRMCRRGMKGPGEWVGSSSDFMESYISASFRYC